MIIVKANADINHHYTEQAVNTPGYDELGKTGMQR
jgi:hypothetical protein